LIAYVVVQNLFNREAVIAYLSSRLPDYMVPQLWVALERLPLTSNGKIDKKALPDVYTNELATNSFVAPRNEFEKQMAATWQQLLGLVNVGIEDNFFELGGDSILTIQVVSRMRRHGFGLTPKDIFIHQNIAGLSAAIADKIGFEVTGEQGLLTGESGLLPIQQWYFEQDNAAVSHYNQSVLLGIEKSVGEAALSAVIEKLLSHHDALRFVYRKNEAGVWQQSYGISKGIVVIENLQDASSSSLADLIKNKADEHQALLNIARGELVRIVLIETPAVETHNRLLLIIHHLVIDGVSWRILLEDFERLLTAISSNQPLQPGSKSSSYRQWYQALELYGKSRNLLSQKEYWQNTIANDTSLPVDKNYEGKVRFMDMAHHSISLNSTATKRLLQEVPKVYHTEINDILLCALAITLNNWSGNNKLVIGLEGHGREDIADDIDASRTVGWFTNLYPVLLETGSAKTNAEQIKSIKEQLRRIPMRGIGYGVLKYINREVELQGKDVWEVVFNYLGQLDNVVKDSNWFTSVGESSGAAVASDIRVNEKLLVNSQVLSGELLLNFSYSSLHYEAATITNLAAAYLSNLLALIEHCIEQVQTNGEVFTPSDYGLGVEIGYEELDAFLSASFNGKKRKDAIESIYRLSGLQEGMLFHGLYDNEAGAYTEQFSCDLVKPDLNCLVKSWQHVIGNHSILRSGFYHDVFAVPVQCVYKSVAFPVETIDYCELNESEQAAAIIAFETADRAKGFDFESAPLMRLTLIRLSEDRYRMLWTSHHILFDGWSLPILMEELLGTYESLVTEKEPVVQEEDKFEDYIRFVERQNKEAEEQYWRQHIAGLEQSTLLPFIGKTVERTKGAGKYSTLPLHLEAPITLSIRQYAKQHHITLNTLMQGVWSLLLHRYTGNNDIAFGVIVSGRPDELPNVEQRVGMYINTLPLHAKLQEDLQLTAWLSRLQDQQVSGRKYQYTSLRQIQDWSGVGGDLFDSILVFENYPVSELIGSKQWLLEIENVQMHEQTNYPLSITIASADTIKIDFSYNTSLLQEIHVAEIRSHFEQVLNQFLSADAGTQLGEIELLTDAEKDQLLIAFNDTRAVYPADKSIISLFEEQVLITPEKIALVFEQERLSYRQLNDRSNQLAHHLAAKGVTIETLVPICIERGIEMMVAILGILKAGGAYVPIDPGYPAERIAFMLEDVAASMVLSSTASGAKLPDGIDVVSIDADWDAIAKESISKLAISTAPNDLAYIIYTSGSTGKPKGVLVTNNNVVSLVTGVDYVSIKREDVLLSTGSSSFDATTFEYWSMLLNGGQLVLCAENRLLDNQLLKEEINTRAVNKMWFTSSWFNQLVETDISLFETLETILVGGEKLSEYHIGKLRQTYPAIEIINGYGPTENTTFSLTYTIAESAIHQPIPIGRPLTNRTAYILDARQRLVPAGVSGEIYLSGDGLSRGYLNRPELTAEKFIKNPFASGLMYRTGDIGRWLPNGNIEYLGRIDDQVKIRGYRIELGEIETVIQQSELVSQAVIIVKDDLKGDKRLLAYIIPTTAYSKDALLAYLRTRLPEYMVPTTWIELVDFELTSNGKINKKALPDADAMPIMDSSYMAPQNELEIKLASIWQEVLKLKQISTSDNFFDLGGHSLSAMRVVSAVRKELDTRIAIKDLFLYPAISSLAKYLQSLEGSTTQKEIGIQLRPEHIPLSFSQKRLWVIDRLEGSNQYHIPLILKLKGNLNKEGLFFALQTIVDRHEVLRTVFYDVDGKGFQSVKERVGWKVLTKDGAHFKNDPAALKVYLEDLVKLPFDLSNDYPVRASLIELDAQEFVLAITMHHIASDAWSNPIAIKELGELYASFITGRNAVLASLKLQYVDYAIWQWSYLQGKVLDEKTAYWKKKMSGVKPLQLTTDFKRPAIKTNNGSILSFDISKQLTDQLSQLSQQQGVSLFMTLLATFKVLLHRYSGDEDICVGTSVANRPQQELEGLIGFFVNTLALRTEVTESALFTELLAKVKTTTIEALDHQDLPFEKVVEVAGIDRDISRSPLFQVMLVLPNIPIASELIIGDVVLSPVEMAATTSKFDFTFHIYQSGYGLSIKVEYNTDLFKENTIERMTEHYKQLLKSVVTMPEQRIDSLQMLTDDEENALMAEFD
jgi:amino acid adenylation domain-containing protein/non-ribosomal peptide synthase protein (TIGR01720 family)